MLADIRALFCRWTPWESQILSRLSDALAAEHRAPLQAQIEAVNKIQRIVGWAEIDLYVMRRGRVCWDNVPSFGDREEFRLAKARTLIDGATVGSELFCVGGHLFSIESDGAVKPFAFRPDANVEIREVDARFA
jgi:hypothetical protein